ncbi:TRAP transporter large permease [Pelagibacterium luteolum]|uniref:TRAP transporter large permease protein n=1 Tax=Pelagibacterium luteolum TaxID=440168 RepID=A0A1G7Z6S1_9HYPH|nr:TRAP transporter large permease [Pelagibacterium luteolum]SDH04408.1 TRAP transporter, DctM subunit [Pelagibacterium luteolum]
MTLLIIAGAMLGMIFIGVPIAVAMLFTSMGYFYITGTGLSFATQRLVDSLNSFPLLAIPLFILAASLLTNGGITNHIFGFATRLVGHVRGGLGHVNVLASVFFSGMSGSAVADTSGLGKMEIDAMRKAGYDDDFSGAVTAASSMIGPIIPPSITLVLYGVSANVSVGALFLAGIIPGLACALALMVMVYIVSVKRNYPALPRARLSEILSSFRSAFWALLTPLIIILGIFGGIFSPTEAAAATVVYAILIDLFIYKQLTWRKIWDSLYESATLSASIAFIVANVGMLGIIFAREQAPQQIAALFLNFVEDPLMFLLMVNILIFFLGAFIESMAILLILVPILVPSALAFGIDPVQFGIIVCFNIMISTLTPPMGMALFVVAKVGNIPFQKLAYAILPWLIPPLVVLALITLFPPLTLFLPSLAG